MAITATFGADYSDFVKETQKAEAALKALEGQGNNVGTALVRTESHSELLRASFQKFDGVLAAMGVNLSQEIKGLQDIAGAADQTASEIGAVSTAGLAFGAGVAGWKIGRPVAEFFDLDKVIGDATAKLLGFGDVAAEVAGAKADVMARASKTIGIEVHNLTDALAINAAALHDWRDNATISAAATTKWRDEIAKVKAAGDLPSLTADLKSHNFTLDDVARRYGVSVQALHVFTRDTEAAATADKEASEKIHFNNERMLKDVKAEMDAHKAARDLAARINVELTRLDEQYTVTALERSGTRSEIEIGHINRAFEIERAILQKKGEFNAEVAGKFNRDWKQALDGVGVDFGAYRDLSVRGLQDIAARAQRTYEQMIVFSGGMSREGIEQARQLRDATVMHLHETDAEHAATFRHMRDEVDRTSFKFREWLANTATDQEKAELGYDAMGRAIHKVGDETKRAMELTGKWYDLQGKLVTSVAFDVTKENFQSLGYSYLEGLFHEGYSLAEALAINAGAPKQAPKGPRLPGFATGVEHWPGGWAMVGERGPEAMYVPPDASIYPHGSLPGLADGVGDRWPPIGGGDVGLVAAEAKALELEINRLTAEIALKTTGAAIGPVAKDIDRLVEQIAMLQAAASTQPAQQQAAIREQIDALSKTLTVLQTQAAAELFTETAAMKRELAHLQAEAAHDAAILAEHNAVLALQAAGQLVVAADGLQAAATQFSHAGGVTYIDNSTYNLYGTPAELAAKVEAIVTRKVLQGRVV